MSAKGSELKSDSREGRWHACILSGICMHRFLISFTTNHTMFLIVTLAFILCVYVQNCSFRNDIIILLLVMPAALGGG